MFTNSHCKVSSFSVPSLLSLVFSGFALVGCAADATRAGEAARDQKQPEEIVTDPVVAPVTVDEKSNGKTIDVAPGQAIVVVLPSNGTTGYEWSVASEATPLGLPEVTYASPSRADAPGTGGTTSFTWASTKTVAAGSYAIALHYKRSWEPDAVDSFSFVVALAD